MKRIIAIGLGLSLYLGCGLDPLIWGETTASDFDLPPEAGQNHIKGASTLLGSGAAVSFYTPGGVTLADAAATTDDAGAFDAAFDASTEFVNTIVTVDSGGLAAWGIVPLLPKKETVYEGATVVTMGTDVGDGGAVPMMDDLGVDSTVATLLLLAKAYHSDPSTTVGAWSPNTVIRALGDIQERIDRGDELLMPLYQMVERLMTPGTTTAPPLRPFVAEGESYLDITALAPGADYDGDADTSDDDTAAFDAALMQALLGIEVAVCYAPDTIRVVLIVDFRDGGMSEGSCGGINRFKWLEPKVMTDDKSMFITGSVHPDTPSCDTDDPPCLTAETYDAASQLMGNWTPNLIAMYDDGTHGDAVAGDNFWTITLDLPWFDAGDPTARWVRITYKYTWGTQGALWTGSEEWPGNRRLLELRDVNGDHLIVRQDVWADEATNKDKKNLRPPSNGGCGSVVWQSEIDEARLDKGCVDDTLERPIDVDRDCDASTDVWPTLFAASPLTVPCEDE
ncbi:MAG: hypothetical protein CSA66_06770 [Proteobacteria bacterium]|nr:MAG: hypothetical protein CSA66_06770 [Pseudomonadota bacterium]